MSNVGLFEASNEAQQLSGSEDGPTALRTIAHRKTEVFVAIGREIRWADLATLKDAYQDGDLYGSPENTAGEAARSHRVSRQCRKKNRINADTGTDT